MTTAPSICGSVPSIPNTMSETPPKLAILRGYELRLLRCTFQSPPCGSSPGPTHHLHPLINDLLTSIESGRYLQALVSPAVKRAIFNLAESDSVESLDDSAERVYSELIDRIESFISNGCEDDRAYRVIVVLCIVVAALFGFTQCNFTGPLKGLPRCPLSLEVPKCDEWDN